MNSADAIARVVADLGEGRVNNLIEKDDPVLAAICARIAQRSTTTTVDATLIYDQVVTKDSIYLYEDHPSCAPPWTEAAVCYRNSHGNVTVMAMSAKDIPPGERREAWATDNPIDWERVRWIIDVPVYVGGRSKGGTTPMPTSGPAHLWRLAVYESGEPADIHWVHLLDKHSMDIWDTAMLVMLGTLNFMGCRNVELVDAVRTQKLKRRRGQPAVTVKMLAVRPMGRSSRSTSGPGDELVPMTSVRGHPAHYGACCPWHEPRGLLFGRLTGRYWIPQHARGDAAAGESRHNYKIVPEKEK